MFSRAGETYDGGDTSKCPGESNCNDWAQPWEPMVQIERATPEDLHAAKEASICRGCPMFSSKSLTLGADAGDEAEDLVDEIEDFILWQNTGVPVDWTAYDFEFLQLVTVWREAEAVVEENRRRRFDALVKGFLK